MKKILLSFFAVLMMMLLASCGNLSLENNYGDHTKENDAYPSSMLSENIVSHIEEWKYACDSFTMNYTYDEIEASGLCLYSANKKGEYYFGALYTMPNDRVVTTYHRIYYVTDSTFQYVYGGEYSATDTTVKNYRVLSIQITPKGSDKTQYVDTMVNEALLAEEKYLNEITLNETEPITLNNEQILLFNHMYAAIKELEYYEPNYSGYRPQVPLAKIEYYNLGNGVCEALLHHGYTSENANVVSSSFYVGGYRINENGYSKLSDADESRLENTSKTVKLEWNVDWTEAKKEYMLKKSIYENS